ncbi:hypothetical protein BFF78_06620 [Streptomyces fodineus]|uniref:Uncharacterized protein n=1 Tax=Streptomyces fodineus TaxID=1904616 RepID=A0A1D7Y5D6_9ACTN|nr:hypothetical protein [Streptomyces fodineus]AOR30764.1 hypothetical protein BFF78_06620 [Streptomyces fodineus]
MKELVVGIDGPVGVMSFPGAPSVAAPAALGVARTSAGSGLARLPRPGPPWELLEAGTYGTPADRYGYGGPNASPTRA